MKKILVGLIFSIFCGLNLFGNDFDLGLEAYEKNDFVKAKELYVKACDGGDNSACYNLGVMYDNGKGVKQDYFKAKELFGKACDLGDQGGCDAYAKLNKQ